MAAPVREERFRLAETLPVDPAAIERELTQVWRTASKRPGAPVTRACAMTLVAITGPGGPDDLTRTLPAYHPARLLALVPVEEPPDALEATATALCRLRGGGRVVCVEEVTVRYGPAAREHLPSLVRALSVGDLPVVLLAIDPAADRSLLERLAPDADVVVDASWLGEEADAAALSEAIRRALRCGHPRHRGVT
jgi:glucose-6-phosphate dehydrogenase assembly protein OpcA